MRASLHYLRTREKKEVDFYVAIDDKIEFIAEAKKRHADVSPALRYFHAKYGLKAFHIVYDVRCERREGDIVVRKAGEFLQELAM
ncbi:hypothetical protein EH222_11295 [candidate division KSB1 bacterium]|nr:MAG: hypothetical protein EH222_11295 [candidate division KSB1 bacterium]